MISSAAVYADFLIQLSSRRIIGPDTLKKMWMQQNLSDCTIVPFATLRWAVHLSAVMEMPARVAVGLQVPVRLPLPPPTPPDPASAKHGCWGSMERKTGIRLLELCRFRFATAGQASFR